ncbi:MAG: hypothetical protein H6Q69_4903 [Firmicutes bacterium]|nr:hypothetical protein [Bacillota bacterium]
MIIFNKKEMGKIRNINFHDAKISKIVCDYDDGTIGMPIIMDDTHQYAAVLNFENVMHMDVNRMEPWGPGCYISSLDTYDAEGDYFKVSILLNSGDEVNIIASKLIYSSSE